MIWALKVSRATTAATRRASVTIWPYLSGRQVRGDGHRRAFPALGENLEQQLGPMDVELHIAELVETEQVDPTVASRRSSAASARVSARCAWLQGIVSEAPARPPPATCRRAASRPEQRNVTLGDTGGFLACSNFRLLQDKSLNLLQPSSTNFNPYVMLQHDMQRQCAQLMLLVWLCIAHRSPIGPAQWLPWTR